VSISINRLAKQLSVSPGVVRTLVDHHRGKGVEIYTANGELTETIAEDVRLQLNLRCERMIPELYIG
jgi:hypothetical protein